MSAKYFRRRWDDSRDDEGATWGPSWWLFETDADGRVQRQLEVYEDGPVLHYDKLNPKDRYGGLSQVDCLWELEDWSEWEIDQETFEQLWDHA
ncbi:MAG: hypothetical protein Q4G67_10855 [Actinomycetia bacterium]|nr:hypothetical protein [Actinomycetes bacterium]